MKSLGSTALAVGLMLLLVAAIAPALIALSGALLPLVIVIGVVVIGGKLAFFHTRRW